MFPSNKSWPLPLIVDLEDVLYYYTPRSDVCVIMNDVPVLLIEVNSSSVSADARRMLLQAAAAVRLGNALLTGQHPNFAVKAIYIGPTLDVTEYTLFQKAKANLPFSPEKQVTNLLVARFDADH
jgi:hypothetical protein